MSDYEENSGEFWACFLYLDQAMVYILFPYLGFLVAQVVTTWLPVQEMWAWSPGSGRSRSKGKQQSTRISCLEIPRTRGARGCMWSMVARRTHLSCELNNNLSMFIIDTEDNAKFLCLWNSFSNISNILLTTRKEDSCLLQIIDEPWEFYAQEIVRQRQILYNLLSKNKKNG